MTTISLSSKPGNVVKIEGECYEFSNVKRGVPTNDIEDVQGVFDNCEDCESLSSSSNSSSISNSSSSSSTSVSSSSSSSSTSTSSSSSSSATPVSMCANEDPEIKLTVTGASGTITWAGETWNLPADAGLTKTVCPDTYNEARSVSFNQFKATHKWEKGGSIATQLDLQRIVYYRWYTFFGSFATWIDGFNHLNVHGDRDQRRFVGNKRPNISVTSTNTTWTDVNKILSVPVALYATTGPPTGTAPPDYFMTAAFFGQHIISGITYSWAKGAGWP